MEDGPGVHVKPSVVAEAPDAKTKPDNRIRRTAKTAPATDRFLGFLTVPIPSECIEYINDT